MSSLVSEFIINPVLRQARRFSRSHSSEDHVEPVSNQRSALNREHGLAVEEITERLEGLEETGARGNRHSQTLSGVALTSSPIEEDGGLESELQAMQDGTQPVAPANSGHVAALPSRMAPLTSDSGNLDDEVSGNPSFGVPGRFRTNSATSSIRNTVNAMIGPAEGSSRRTTLDMAQSGSGSHQRSSSLPEDDGMGPLRQRILMIQVMDITADEKARMMHTLLTQGYSQAQEMYHAKQQPERPLPANLISQERPTSPGSLSSFLWQMNGAPDGPAPNHQHTFRLSPADLKSTYAPLDLPEVDDDGEVRHQNSQEQVLGCRHYKRNVKLQCASCDQWHTCRYCHDEVEDHVLNRKATKNMLCMICGCAQRAGEFCVGCGERTAWYYCDVCKLWDNDTNKNIYHCNDCGICRKGRGLGKDFFHCKTCGTCMTTAVEQSHKCIERVADCDCPICGEYMFTSPLPVVFMLCGHGIHKACYDEHLKSSYKCPICSKSMVNMETQFRNLDRSIDSQPMPPEFQDTKAMVSCNDCYAKSAVKYHWLGLKCAICDSYNTAQLSLLSDPEVEVPPIENMEIQDVGPVEATNGEAPSSALHLSPGLSRHRRHSSLIEQPSTSLSVSVPQRLGRSVSPIRELGYFASFETTSTVETVDSAGDNNTDDLDFWGRDGPRCATSAENMDEEMDEDEESDDDLTMDDCDEDGDEEDQFELIGHR